MMTFLALVWFWSTALMTGLAFGLAWYGITHGSVPESILMFLIGVIFFHELCKEAE